MPTQARHSYEIKRLGTAPIWALAAALAGLTIAFFWPGEMIGNTVLQLQQIESGQLTDWHPPLMAVIWRAIGTTPQSLLILNSLLYWFGIGLVADEMWRRKSPVWGLAVFAVGLSPIALTFLGRVQRDNFMVSLLLISAGLGQKFGVRLAFVPGFLATLFRTDAIFALPPLIVQSRNWLKRLVLCLALAIALFPVCGFVNRTLLGASPAYAERSLQLFDIAGIQARTGDVDSFEDLRRCYTPFWWDSLEKHCRVLSKYPHGLTREWATAIIDHPVAYAIHRVEHFNQATFFLVRPFEDCRQDPKKERCAAGRPSLWLDALTRNPLLWPITWIVIGGWLLFVKSDRLTQVLTWSGMGFGLAHLIVGVSSEYRYFFWPELAIQLALVWHVAHVKSTNWRVPATLLLATWLAGYAFRYLPQFG